MTTDQPTGQPVPNPSIAQQRLDILAALIEVATEHNLPALMQINFTSGGGLGLRLNEGDRDGVHAWTSALNNGDVTETHFPNSDRPFTAVKSGRYRRPGPTWRDLYLVDIWSACPYVPQPQCTLACDDLQADPAKTTGLARSWHSDDCPVPVHHYVIDGVTKCGITVADLPAAHGYTPDYDTDSVTCKDCRTAYQRHYLGLEESAESTRPSRPKPCPNRRWCCACAPPSTPSGLSGPSPLQGRADTRA